MDTRPWLASTHHLGGRNTKFAISIRQGITVEKWLYNPLLQHRPCNTLAHRVHTLYLTFDMQLVVIHLRFSHYSIARASLGKLPSRALRGFEAGVLVVTGDHYQVRWVKCTW